ncbi:hypothetical protein GALMADRAFT_890392 [Galerina marginata CBS 339.88]|uniref:F-box domain-containing protein n=1 Tax=Galerina marginata (strain CBS 339.88) TaxID=685588 RepID=A0A067SR50_GALM3|nr:hypothetical protein GALMADRAFT_890392 [Galerina marginata CBS 339.88]
MRRMASSFTKNKPVLPQELIDLILDKLALQTPQEESIAALQASSLVSRSFHSQSRRHLFSDIELVIDKSNLERASRLRRILQRGWNDKELVSVVRSLKLVLEVDARRAIYKARKTSVASAFLTKLGLNNNDQLKLVQLFAHSNLEALTVEAQARSFHIDPVLLQICSCRNLTSLRLVNIVNIPSSIITEALSSCCLFNLELCNILIIRDNQKAPDRPNQHRKQVLSRINRLEIRHVPYHSFFALLSSPLGGFKFPNLRILEVSTPSCSEEVDALRDLVQAFSPSLETLELERGAPPGFFPTGFIFLNHLTSLRTLKFTARCTTYRDFQSQLGLLNSLLASATSPAGIHSIKIRFCVQLYSGTQWVPDTTWRMASGWTTLDNLLVGKTFVDLQRVSLTVETLYADSSLPKNRYVAGPNSKLDAEIVLPATSASSSLSLSLEVYSVWFPRPMEYLYF